MYIYKYILYIYIYIYIYIYNHYMCENDHNDKPPDVMARSRIMEPVQVVQATMGVQKVLPKVIQFACNHGLVRSHFEPCFDFTNSYLSGFWSCGPMIRDSLRVSKSPLLRSSTVLVNLQQP